MIERITYKGRTILSLKRDRDDKYAFGFGYNKARLILENIDEIKKYVNDCQKLQSKAAEEGPAR